MAIKLDKTLSASEWSKHKSILSKHTGIGNQLKMLEREAAEADEHEPDDLQTLIEITGQLVNLTFKAMDKKNNWAEKTADWLDQVDDAAKKLHSKLHKMLPEAEKWKKESVQLAHDAMMNQERKKKLQALRGKMPNGCDKGADLKTAANIMTQGGADMAKFNNVNTIAASYDALRREIRELVSIMDEAEASKEAEEKEELIKEFNKVKKRLEPVMDGVLKAAEAWAASISSWNLRKTDPDLHPLATDFSTLINQLLSHAAAGKKELKVAAKQEAKVEKEVDAIYKTMEEEELK